MHTWGHKVAVGEGRSGRAGRGGERTQGGVAGRGLGGGARSVPQGPPAPPRTRLQGDPESPSQPGLALPETPRAM